MSEHHFDLIREEENMELNLWMDSVLSLPSYLDACSYAFQTMPESAKPYHKKVLKYLREKYNVTDDNPPLPASHNNLPLDVVQQVQNKFFKALNIVMRDRCWKNKYDHAFVLKTIQQQKLSPAFTGIADYVDFTSQRIANIKASRRNIEIYYGRIAGSFGEWTFSDPCKQTEAQRRNNVGKRFNSAYRTGS